MKTKWLDTSIHALWMWNQQAHCFNFKLHTRTQESHCTSPSPPPAKWLTEHRHYHTTWKAFSSNSCDSWLYSRYRWSVSYLCWGSLVLLPRCSAPPPLFPGRAGEERNEPQKEGDVDSWHFQVLVLTSIFSTEDRRLLRVELMFSWGQKQ